MDDNTFDAVFFLTLSTAILAFLGLALKSCFKSKCSNVNLCCGLINVQRDVITEENIHDFDIEHGIINNQSTRNIASIHPLNINRNDSH